MNSQKEIIKQIKTICKRVVHVPYVGWFFIYDEMNYLYITSKGDKMIRFCIPHLIKVSSYDSRNIIKAINETNKNVRYVKAIVQDNGSVMLEYDYYMVALSSKQLDFVPHIVNSLSFAAHYLISKLEVVQ